MRRSEQLLLASPCPVGCRGGATAPSPIPAARRALCPLPAGVTSGLGGCPGPGSVGRARGAAWGRLAMRGAAGKGWERQRGTAAPGTDPVSVLQRGRAAGTASCPPPAEAEGSTQLEKPCLSPAGWAGGALQPPRSQPRLLEGGKAVSTAINLPAAVAPSPGADAASSPCTALPSLRQLSLVQAARSRLGLESAQFRI